MECCKNDKKPNGKKAAVKSWLLLPLVFCGINACAQQFNTDSLAIDSLYRTALKDPNTKKNNFRKSSIELLGAQALPWCFNRYVRKAAFAKISFQSVATNLNPAKWEMG